MTNDELVDRLRGHWRGVRQGCAQLCLQCAAADEIERLRAENAAWRTGVADAVEPFGFDREAACGPADLLPGLVTLVERLADLRTVGSRLADTSYALGRAQALIAWIDGACTDLRPHADIEAAIGRWKDTSC